MPYLKRVMRESTTPCFALDPTFVKLLTIELKTEYSEDNRRFANSHALSLKLTQFPISQTSHGPKKKGKMGPRFSHCCDNY